MFLIICAQDGIIRTLGPINVPLRLVFTDAFYSGFPAKIAWFPFTGGHRVYDVTGCEAYRLDNIMSIALVDNAAQRRCFSTLQRLEEDSTSSVYSRNNISYIIFTKSKIAILKKSQSYWKKMNGWWWKYNFYELKSLNFTIVYNLFVHR